MDTLAAAACLQTARRVVIKIGSALLVEAETGALRETWLEGLAEDVAGLRARGVQVLLVSSGSIALGRRVLGLPQGHLTLDQAQAAASVGQIRLAKAYQEVLGAHGITAAQLLVTLEDSANRRRYLNSRATIATLLDLGAVPIVNENDTVATDEIRFGDNDRLAAQVTALSGGDLLVLLSDVDGLYEADPRLDQRAAHIPLVRRITPQIEALAGDAGTAGAKGGMRTKIMAAQVAVKAGAAMVIARGDVLRPLRAIDTGARVTVFAPEEDPQAARKRWILSMKPKGTLRVDGGAARALSTGKSLLPAGVTAIEGRFERGDAVDIIGPEGPVARGLAGYDAVEARLIMGHKSSQITERLGHPGRAALVHRDDMAL
ncbi:MAG: glutamate 5-kinase [Pseudomonadota bacterium]